MHLLCKINIYVHNAVPTARHLAIFFVSTRPESLPFAAAAADDILSDPSGYYLSAYLSRQYGYILLCVFMSRGGIHIHRE